ncbi:hypothetical protein OGV25_01290 [Pseudomonas sp. P1B16]|uniref:hypothetical protein n=1 Tax=Pseudomonas sp. P1B16 TaxID=2986074 RepID=UPI002A23D3A7|nr:hypothetical protein [Pseudomonas sp. P1B16]WPM27006.1 hypothetical protein OGV25_01290 [Pseudomonas sp. P1B16]
MENSTIPTEPRFIDQNNVSDILPTFTTRTTLRSILQGIGVNTLSELEARSATSPPTPIDPPGR